MTGIKTSVHQKRTLNSLGELLHSSKYSDLTIRCGSEDWRVHRNIEAKTSTIILEDDDPATVRRMLTYLYTVDYDDKSDDNGLASAGAEPATSKLEQVKADSSLIDQMIADVLVYAIADKYNIPELKELSMSKFEALLDDESVPNKFAAVVDAVYTTTPDTDSGLRDMIIDYCAENIDTFAESEEYFRIFQDRGDFGRSVLGAVLCTHKGKIDEETRSLKTDLQGLSWSAGKYMTRVPNAMIEDFKFRLDAMND